MDNSVLVSGIAAGISLVALGTGRYDRWRAEEQRREDLQRAEERRQEDFERARPRFRVEWRWNIGQSGVWIGVNVTALPGRPGTSLVEVGLALDGEVDLDNPSGVGFDPPHARGHASFPIHREITACEPGRRYPFQLEVHGLGPFIDPETELIPYVVDVEGTRHQGNPFAVFGRMLREGWRPQGELATLRFMSVTYTFPPERSGEVAFFDLADATSSP